MTFSNLFVRIGACCLGLFLLNTALAEDWPQWRGPNRDGISKETGLLKDWPADGPRLVWQKTDIGDGYSTPAVVGNRLYLISDKGLENEFVHALNVENGEQIWEQKIGIVGNPKQDPAYPGSRSTPTIDGKVLYALGSDGDLVCMEIETRKILWQKHLRGDFGGKYGKWAYAESPLIDGDTLVCTPGGEQATLIALNKRNGEVIWKSQVPGNQDAGYSSIMIANAAGTKQYVQFLEKGLVGVDAASGKFLWQYERTGKSPANIPTPIVRGDLVYSSSGGGGGALVKLVSSGGKITPQEVYFDAKLPKAIGGSILLGDYLYGSSGPLMMCVEYQTKKEAWTKERGVSPASLCYADGNFYLHGENDGQVALVEATPQEFREHGRFAPSNPPERGNSKAWAYPVVANGRLYIRDRDRIWCYDVKARASALKAHRKTPPE